MGTIYTTAATLDELLTKTLEKISETLKASGAMYVVSKPSGELIEQTSGKIDRPSERALMSMVSSGVVKNANSIVVSDMLSDVHAHTSTGWMLNQLYKKDIEIMGLVASSLAYGRVQQILKSISKIETIFKMKPYEYITSSNLEIFTNDLADFKHRFTKGFAYAKFLEAIRLTLIKHKTIEQAFMLGYKDTDIDTHDALNNFYKMLSEYGNSDLRNIFPNPEKGSACKRMHLWLKWMLRNDDVDPGIWNKIPKSKLLIPLDTHILDISFNLGFIDRKLNSIKIT